MAYQSGEWVLVFREVRTERKMAEVKPPQLKWSLRNSEKGEMTCELPIGMTQYDGITPLRRDSIVPWHTDWYLYRGTNLRESGIVTSINVADDRDTVMVAGMSWLGYLEHRIYPFDPDAYVNDRDWESWPKMWGQGEATGVDLRIIVEDILEAMLTATIDVPAGTIQASANTPQFILANRNTGSDGRYKILPGDETTIFEHIKKLAENSDGFEFDVLPQNLEFRMYVPNRDQGIPVYRFTKTERLVALDWTNEGPLATVSTIYGTGSSLKRGIIRTDLESVRRYRWTDRVANVGQVASQDALEKAALGEQFEDRFPRKRAGFVIHDPELLSPNFWTFGRPRSLIGNRVRVTHDFGFHRVNADYIIQALNFEIDEHGNESVSFEPEMINTPETALEFGGGGGGFEPR